MTTACTHKMCPPDNCMRAERLTKAKLKAEVERIEAANRVASKPELMGAPGTMNNGRYIDRALRLKQLAHGFDEEMIQIVVELARQSDNDFCRLAAANSLLDRVMGKATQYVETAHTEEHKIQVELLTPEIRAAMVSVLDAVDPARKLPSKA